MSAPTLPRALPMDLTGALPDGTWVLEASAGTGKTYTIAGLVSRYVAEGTPLHRVLAITFGRAATGELRTRVRERLLHVHGELAGGSASTSKDPVARLLSDADHAEVALRRQRLAAALAGFDAATVATTHEFCQQVLHGLGVAADLDPGTVLVEDLDDLVTEACDDLYLAYTGATGTAPFGYADALRLARAAVAQPLARLTPADSSADSPEALRVRFAGRVRAEVRVRARARRVLGFDDLLSRVRDALVDPVSGPVARQRLRDRFAVVLVDEFQDTDPVQWEVLLHAFHDHRTLVVIGDPKQSVYAFRGADVQAYLDASRRAHQRRTLDTSWRGDPGLLEGLQSLFRGAPLGDVAIVVDRVLPGHQSALLEAAAPDPAPVRVRRLSRDGLATVKSGLLTAEAARLAVARDVAAEVTGTLAAGLSVTPRDGGQVRPLLPQDIAVVVRTGLQASVVREQLQRVGVPCVLTGTHSVFDTPAARDWLLLLEALEQPHRAGLVRRVALTSLIGWSAADVAERGADGADRLGRTLREWAQVLTERGVAALQAAIADRQQVAERLLRRADGERLLTDLRHVGEILHAEALESQLGLAGLITWLHRRVQEARGDLDAERSRRLDTDDDAVQVATVHTSKGLEFPVVLVPYGWDRIGGGDRERLPLGHDADGHRTLYVGGPAGAGYTAACALEDADEAGEELRLLYVAATRAISRVVLWWAPSTKTPGSPLHRLLFTADPTAGLPAELAVPADPDAAAELRRLEAAPGLAVQDVHAGEITDLADVQAPPAPVELAAATLDRQLDADWRRTSYTGLTRAAYEQHAGVQSEPDVPVTDDEPDPEADGAQSAAEPAEPVPDADLALREVPSPMADLPGGATFGTLVHAVLERVDLAAADLPGELAAVAEQQLAHRSSAIEPGELAAALLPALRTGLGPLADGRTLAGTPRRDLLPELAFELPLDGGDVPGAGPPIRLGNVAGLLRRHLPVGDPVAPYAPVLEHPALSGQPLRGYLTGSLDLVLRVGTPDAPRFLVVDHKTNHLAPTGEPLTAWHYRRAALDAEVLHAHYPLQALLYSVALHRFLRWRLPRYDPQQHLGGVLYLFLRGMCGPDAHRDAQPAAGGEVPGVWSWRPPAELVGELSALLAGRLR